MQAKTHSAYKLFRILYTLLLTSCLFVPMSFGQSTDSIEQLRNAAEQGDVTAMTRLGIHLRNGDGVEWSEAEAMQWFFKAARQGYAPAEAQLAFGYMNGLGQDTGQGVQDYREAAFWFTQAARQGDGFSQILLGNLYENGWGVAQDTTQSRELYQLAAGNPNPQIAELGRQRLAGSESSGSGDSLSKALPWIIGAAALVAIVSASSNHSDTQTPSSSSSGSTSSSSSSSSNLSSSSSSPPPRQKNCRIVPANDPFTIQHGKNAIAPSGATTQVCD
jgi:TPR repeat protein